MSTERRALLAYTLPFALFMAGLVAVAAAKAFGITTFAGIPLDPMYWIYPIQTAICAAALLWFWRCYDVGAATTGNVLAGLVVGLLIFGLWVAPQELLHQARRTEGFDPGVVPGMTPWMTAGRFTRLVIIVPLVEEISGAVSCSAISCERTSQHSLSEASAVSVSGWSSLPSRWFTRPATGPLRF